jgi:hypothetical protein
MSKKIKLLNINYPFVIEGLAASTTHVCRIVEEMSKNKEYSSTSTTLL